MAARKEKIDLLTEDNTPVKKTTKRTVKARRSIKKTPIKTTELSDEKSMNTNTQPIKALKVKRSYVLTLLVILLAVAGLLLTRNYLIVAMVNGSPISRFSVISELEKQSGKQVLDSLVTRTLILQEAKEKNINVSQEDVDKELKEIEANLAQQGQKLDQVLDLQGMTKDQLVDQIRLQKMLEKMVGNVAITDEEVNSYIESNKEALPQDQEEAELKANVKSSLAQQKTNTKAQEFLENLRKDAKIDYYVQY